MADDYSSYEDAYNAQDQSDYQPSEQFNSMWGGDHGGGGGVGGENFDWGSWLGQGTQAPGPQAGDIAVLGAAKSSPASQYSNTEMPNPGSRPVAPGALDAGVAGNLPADAQKFDYGQPGEVPQQNPASGWGSPQGQPAPAGGPPQGSYMAGDMPSEFALAQGHVPPGQVSQQPGDLRSIAAQPGYEMGSGPGAGGQFGGMPGSEPVPSDVSGGGTPAGGNPIANLLARATAGGNAGNLINAATGAAGVGMMGAGLMHQVPKLKNPDYSAPAQMSPEQRDAYSRMQAQQGRLQGVAQAGGTAGEQKILATMNDKLQAALKGDMETADPNTVFQLNLEEAQLHTRMANELGNGWETSTAGQNVMRNFELYKKSVLFQAKQAIIQQYSNMGLQRSQFAEGLNEQPIALSEHMMGDLTGMQQGQVGMRMGVQQANQAYDANTREGLMRTGGQIAGYAAAPYMARAAHEQYAKVNT